MSIWPASDEPSEKDGKQAVRSRQANGVMVR